MGYIYKITFKNTDKVYIGQTIQNPEDRFNKHIRMLNNNNHHSKKLQKDWGILSNPSISILEECAENILNEREVYWIKYYNSYINGYNGNEGGNNIGRGYLHTAAKYQEEDYICILTFLAYTDWTMKSISEELDVSLSIVESINSGYSHTNLSKEYPELYKLATSKQRKGMYQVTKRQDVISPEGKIYSIDNVAKFEREHNLVYGGIRNILLGKRKTHKGWKLAEGSRPC